MKRFTLDKRDVYDLAMVVATVVKEQSEKLDFKEVLHLQKISNYLLSTIQDFKSKIENLSKEKDVYVKNANAKISEYKIQLHKKTEVEGVVDESYKNKIDSFVQEILEQAQAEIDKEITPQYEELYNVLGKERVDVEIEEEKHKMLVDKFELYAKEKYIDKSRMIEVYEALVSANAK